MSCRRRAKEHASVVENARAGRVALDADGLLTLHHRFIALQSVASVVSNKSGQQYSGQLGFRDMAKARSALAVSAIDRDEVGHWLSAHGTPQQVSLRGQIILAAADGPSDSAIARALAINRKTVTLWRARYAAGGLESLWEVAPGRGRKPRYGPEKIEQIVEATLQTTPPFKERPLRFNGIRCASDTGCRTGVVG